jgi:hypothetical protein
MREEYRTIDLLRRERETELVDLRKKLNAGDFTAAEQVTNQPFQLSAVETIWLN